MRPSLPCVLRPLDLALAAALPVSLLGLSACGSVAEYYPFRAVEHDLGEGAGATGDLRWHASLQGVIRIPAEGEPTRRYELTIEIDQGAADAAWEPIELASTAVHDDEGNVFAAGEVLVAEAERTRTRRYMVVYPLRRAYRFQSIGRASVVWRLRAPAHRPVSIHSRFRH
jgi:hypothetical protein